MSAFNRWWSRQHYDLQNSKAVKDIARNAWVCGQRLPPDLDSRDFYEMMQVYRHADICNARDAFEAVKEWLRNPTYEWGDK